MPYCSQCGNEVQQTDRYCAKCGGAQPSAGPAGFAHPAQDPFAGVNSRTASLLCYIPVVGWVWAIIVLASARYRSELQTRFHAFQGLYLFVAWLLVEKVAKPMFRLPFPHSDFGFEVLPGLLTLAVMGAWIFMIIKTAQGENFRLPILGELADRSVSEQR